MQNTTDQLLDELRAIFSYAPQGYLVNCPYCGRLVDIERMIDHAVLAHPERMEEQS